MIGLLWLGITVLAFVGWLMLVGVCREENKLKSQQANVKTSVVK